RGTERDDRDRFGPEPERANGHAVLAGRESSNAERAVGGTRDAAGRCTSGHVPDVDRGRSNGDAGSGAHNSAMDRAGTRRLRPEGRMREDRNQKTDEEPEVVLAHRMAGRRS